VPREGIQSKPRQALGERADDGGGGGLA
jgi:hypothetical protein